jgi:indole-3-glycerol phosphate synthase
MATYLDRILAHHRERISTDRRSLADLRARSSDCPPPRGFRAALVASPGLAVIAEIKRRSPSKGPLAADLDPASLARSYERGGAAALSVLTEGPHFGGSPEDLASARAATGLPVLRKDFTVGEADIWDARLMGADAVLLIVAALSDGELAHLDGVAAEAGLDVLVETHDVDEVGRAISHTRAGIVGVNQRDLVTFEVDTDRAVRVAAALPDDAVAVAESGIDGPASVARLAEAGFAAVLVGEHLVRSGDPESAVKSLTEAGAARR